MSSSLHVSPRAWQARGDASPALSRAIAEEEEEQQQQQEEEEEEEEENQRAAQTETHHVHALASDDRASSPDSEPCPTMPHHACR
jgi:hypothetical protein